MNYRIDNLQYCKWSREIFQINRDAGLDAVHVTVVYHEDYNEFLQRIKEWDKHFKENSDLIFLGKNYIRVFFKMFIPFFDSIKKLEVIFMINYCYMNCI